jgi:hypothetical protein
MKALLAATCLVLGCSSSVAATTATSDAGGDVAPRECARAGDGCVSGCGAEWGAQIDKAKSCQQPKTIVLCRTPQSGARVAISGCAVQISTGLVFAMSYQDATIGLADWRPCNEFERDLFASADGKVCP